MLKSLKTENEPVVFYDLDKIVAETTVFRLHGKIFKIKPLTAIQFFQYTQAYSAFRALSEKENLSKEDLADGYFNVFSTVCDSITPDDIQKCSQQQAAVIFGVILDAVTGKGDESQIKKKTLGSRLNFSRFRERLG